MESYVGSARRDISPDFVLKALRMELCIELEWVSVHRYRSEDFLVAFARPEHLNRLSSRPSLEHRGVRLFFRQWTRQSQVVHTMFKSKVCWRSIDFDSKFRTWSM